MKVHPTPAGMLFSCVQLTPSHFSLHIVISVTDILEI